MTDPTEEKPPGSESAAPEVPTVKPLRKKRKRSLSLDRKDVAAFVTRTFKADLDIRERRMGMKAELEEMRHGWLPEKDWPWDNCSNVWVPIILISELRMKATLENAVKSTRPLMEAHARQRRNRDKEKKINQLLDFQFFAENQGEKKIDAIVANYVQDDAVFISVPYVREDQTIRDIRTLKPLDPEQDVLLQLMGALKILFPDLKIEPGSMDNVQMLDNDGWDWKIEYTDSEEDRRESAKVEFYDTEDGNLQAYITRKVRTFDGPAPQPLDFEDVVFPARSANLQIPDAANPYGAPYVHIVCKMSVDRVKRRMSDGTFDLLTEEDFDKIKKGKSATGSGQPEEEPKKHKDALGGDDASFHTSNLDDRPYLVSYARWDVNNDGLDEDVIFWTFHDANVVAKMAYLSELYPGSPLMRPIESESFFPTSNRVYGRSFGSILLSIQEMMQRSMNQHIDWGTIMNAPWFFYRASSGMKEEQIYLEPGVGYPLADPPNDVNFPQFAQRGETFNINTMSLLQTFHERLSMLPDTAYGRIPTGKASAMRNVGTITALTSQIDVRTEQVLRRLLHLFASMYHMMHRLNRRYLPPRKEVRILGMAEQGKDPYTEITAESQEADVDFEFKATMMNTNKEMVAQNLMQTAALMTAPLAIQAGIVTEEEVYNLLHDLAMARDQDPDRYLKRPPAAVMGPKITAEEAFTSIINGEMPVGMPEEPAAEHLQKFLGFQNFPPEAKVFFLAFTPERQLMYRQWAQQVQMQVQMEMQRRLMLAQAAGAAPQNGKEGPGGVPGRVSEDTGGPTPVNANEAIDESLVQ